MRNKFRFYMLFFFAAVLASTPSKAEPPQPVISWVYPAGGQRGKTVEVTVGGANLQGANAVRFSGAGVSASVAQAVNDKSVRLSVTIASDAELGERDIRLITPGGVSNRFRFFVGTFPEVKEVEPNSEKTQAQSLESIPVVVNGQIFEADRDFFRFTAKAGQTLVFEVHARRVLPYIADAVPGWLESCLTLYDANGKELKYADDFRFRPDPVLIHTFQKDGEYLIEIHDIIYRGREDFVYRLTIAPQPYITDIFPLGGQRNSATQVELRGVNLQTMSMSLTPTRDAHKGPGYVDVSVSQNGFTSNALPFAVSDTPEAREVEPNDSIAQANKVEVPITVNGRIQKPGDVDYSLFSAKEGQSLIMEVQARRLDSPIDSIVTLLNAKGEEIAENDEFIDPEYPLITHHSDSRLAYTFRSAGDYVLRIRDVQGKGGDEYAYRLIIAPPRPDYSLTITPDVSRLGQGDTAMITVNALRKDGFNGEIALSVQNLPTGFIAPDVTIPAGQNQIRLTITAPSDAPIAVVSPTIVGTATIGNQAVTRQATPAEAVMQAFAYTYIVPTKEFVVAVIAPDYFTLSTNQSPGQVLQVKPGSEVQVVVKAVRKQGRVAINLTVVSSPSNMSVKTANISFDQDEATIILSVSSSAPVGLRQNVVITGTMRAGRDTITRVAPAIPIQVVAAQK